MTKISVVRKVTLAFFCAVICSCSTATFPSLDDAYTPEGKPDIDLGAYKITLNEEFNRIKATSMRCGVKGWYAHTPWDGDFGASRFGDPSRDFPFVAKRGMVRIEASKDPSGRWFSGLLSSRNACGEGFAQQFGYFEMRALLPKGDGFWPAFWLVGAEHSEFTAEVDVLEMHTTRPDKIESALHVFPHTENGPSVNLGSSVMTPPDAMSGGFNTYGVSVEEDFTVFYFNRREFWREPTPKEFHQPLSVLLDLAMEADDINDSTPNPAYMYVDYVKVFSRR
jgi:beta-glucanase (GH16 family)